MVKPVCSDFSVIKDYADVQKVKENQRTNGPVNAHLTSLPGI